MEGIFEKILKHKAAVIGFFAFACVLCALLARTVSVNYNMADYLPDDAKSTLALNVMQEEYKQDIPNVRVMIPNVTIAEALNYKARLSELEGVKEINWLDDSVSLDIPLEVLNQDTVENWYKDKNALYSLTIDTKKQIETIDEIREIIGEEGAMTGTCVNTVAAMVSTSAELSKIMVIIIPIILTILFLTTSSWFEPILFLLTIGVAILLNAGTNAIFGEISFVTKAAGSLLQLAVSMDYSIFLLHRFSEFREEGLNVNDAMIKALKKSFSSITASGITTVIGFAALILMRFKIGPDMGWVMAKGIFFSLVCVLVLLPVLGILCYKLIDKTKHKPFVPQLKHFKKVVPNIKVIVLILFVIVAVPSFLAQSSNSFLYGSSEILGDESTQIYKEKIQIEEEFGKRNEMVLMLPNGSLSNEKAVSKELKEIPEVSSILSYVDTVGAEIPMEYLPKEQKSKLVSQNYTRMVLSIKADYEDNRVFEVVEEIREIAKNYYGEAYHLVGESVNTYDMKDVVTTDNVKVNMIAIGAVAVVLILTFRSMLLPIILLSVIEVSVWINLSVPYFADETMFFIAYLIISSIQLGATVDYAILFTNRYKENREVLDKKEAVMETISDTTISILTSASILTVCGTILGIISTNGVISQLGFLIGRGAAISFVLVLFVLPALLFVFDGLIGKNIFKWKVRRKQTYESIH